MLGIFCGAAYKKNSSFHCMAFIVKYNFTSFSSDNNCLFNGQQWPPASTLSWLTGVEQLNSRKGDR